MESFCLLSLKRRFSIRESFNEVLKFFLFESNGLSIRIDSLSWFAVNGKLITSEKPFSTKKLSIFEIIFSLEIKSLFSFNDILFILSNPIILAISSDKSFCDEMSCLNEGTFILSSISKPSLLK